MLTAFFKKIYLPDTVPIDIPRKLQCFQKKARAIRLKALSNKPGSSTIVTAGLSQLNRFIFAARHLLQSEFLLIGQIDTDLL